MIATRFLRTAADRRAAEEGCQIDENAADFVRGFLRKFCRHSKGRWAGQPLELLPWQWTDIVFPLFAWKRPDGTRRYRRAYIEVPKKNGKSTLAAGLALYLLVADSEPGPEVYVAAYGRAQAKIVFGEVERMVKASPDLQASLQCYLTANRIVDESNNGFLTALSAEAPLQEGLNIHGLVFDELHTQKTRALWETLRDGGASREQPLLISITTAGGDRSDLCKEQHDYATAILEGSIDDPSFLPVIYAASPEDPWDDPETWGKANPSLGETLTLEGLENDARQARVSPGERASFKRRRLNLWVESAARWLDVERWDLCRGREADWKDLEGKECVLGLDLASTTDLVALALAFPLGDQVALLSKFWAPESAARKREKENRVRFDGWHEEGSLSFTGGDVIDYEAIRLEILDLAERYRIREVALDRWNATQLGTQLDQDGIQIILFGQGYRDMAAPTKRLEEMILEEKIVHDGQPVLRWCISNVVCEEDAAGNRKPSRRRSAEKIDGAVACIMAIGRLMLGTSGRSIYEERGLISI